MTAEPAPRPLFVSQSEAARMLGVSHTFVASMIARDELPCRKFGRRKLIPVAALDALAAEVMAHVRGEPPDAA